jgi:hypothetical protein
LSEVLASEDLTEEEVRSLRELVAKEVLRNLSAAYGVMRSSRPIQVEELPGAIPSIVVVVSVIGRASGVIRATFINEKTADGVTLAYWILEAARGPEGLKVKVAVEPERKEGVLFVIEGVIPSGKV